MLPSAVAWFVVFPLKGVPVALSLPQLKIVQEAITLAVFVPFAFLYMKQPLKLDYLWASL